jgi:hypothetical protein
MGLAHAAPVMGPVRSFLYLPLLAVVAIGCGPADSARVGSSSEAFSPTYGVDYSFARPSPASIRAAGFTFVARYLSYEPAKNLSAAEADSLIAAGLTVVCNWEDGATNALSGYGQGVSDATAAAAQARADGQPTTRPIYFSVDFDADSGQLDTIEAYFEGVASVIGVSRTGVYGGYYIVHSLFDAGKVAWGWQTYAWSYGSWDSRAQFRQIENGIDGDEEDEDEAVVGDFGQWPIAAPPPPPPSPTRGSLDSVTCDEIAGWAEDPNSAGTAIPVDLYVDGPAGSGSLLGRFTAGNDRADLCKAIGSCDHGFAVQTDARLYDGREHSVYAYAIAATKGVANGLLGGAPKALHCAAALTGDFEGSGSTEVLQFRDDWQTLPTCGRWGSDWSCSDRAAGYTGGIGAGNSGSAVYPGATPLVGDVNGDGRDDVLEFNAAWQSIPVCFSAGHSWACKNLRADYVGGRGAGNEGTGIHGGGAPFVGDVNGDGKADLIEYNSSWQTIPVCFATDDGWSCENLSATYAAGIGAGNEGSGIYGATTTLVGDVNGDGKADLVQYNPAWQSIPVCFSTGRGWSCENRSAMYVGGVGAGNAGSGVYSATTVKLADVNGDGKADIVQTNPEWASIPVCFSTDDGWSCDDMKASYIGGLGAGNGGSGIYGPDFGPSTVLVADVNGDGNADVLQYSEDWESVPVCFSTGDGFACENLKANYTGGPTGAGQGGTAIYAFGVPLVGRFAGGKTNGIVQINPDSGWTSLPLCTISDSGWACSNAAAAVY